MVFEDFDGDGIRDPIDGGLPGAYLYLYNAGPDGVIGGGDDRWVGDVQAGGSGRFRFENLDDGNYYLQFYGPWIRDFFEFSPPNVGPDDTRDSDVDPANGRTDVFSVVSGAAPVARDAGMYLPASVGGQVWDDANRNGVREEAEHGVPGVVVNLLKENGVTVATTSTSRGGHFAFSAASPGPHWIEVVAPAGLAFTLQNQGGDELRDSDVDQNTGRSDVVWLTDFANANIDAGFLGPLPRLTLGGFAWDDADGDGIRRLGEQGIEGVEVNLLDPDRSLVATTTTNVGGSYDFPSVVPGQYSVEFRHPEWFVLSPMNRGANDFADSDVNRSTGRTPVFDAVPWESWAPISVGLYGGPLSDDVRSSLRITEIMLGDTRWNDPRVVEFVELKNISAEPLDLRGVRFIDGIAFDFTFGDLTTLFPGEYVVVTNDLGEFHYLYDTSEMNVAGEYAGWLNNDGERIELVATINQIVQRFEYDPDWFALIEDWRGFSLTVRDETAHPVHWDHRSNWRLGSLWGGSPGADDPRLLPDPGAVVINEVMSNPSDGFNDWIELYNTTDTAIDVSGWHLADDRNGNPRFLRYPIPAGTVIPPGGYVVFTRAEDFGFGLSSFGEILTLTAADAQGNLMGYSELVHFGGAESDVTFGRHTVENRRADGIRTSMEGDWQYVPGEPVTTLELEFSGVSGEILDLDVTDLTFYHEFIGELTVELTSPAGTTVELFSQLGLAPDWGESFQDATLDDEASRSIAEATLPLDGDYRPSGWLADFDGQDPEGTWTLTITNPQGIGWGYMSDWSLELEIGTDETDLVALSRPTMGGPNAPVKVGPVVIHEVMYHPAFLHDEFLELYNTTAALIDVGGWIVEGIGSYELPQGTVVPIAGTVLVVPIEPAAFRAKYAIPGAVPIVGPYFGALNNGGDDLALYALDANERKILVDRVDYDNRLPWPEEADMGGGSLQRVVPDDYGNDPANWRVLDVFGGTPGVRGPWVAGRHVFYNNSTFDGNDPAAGAADDAAIAPNKVALLPGQRAAFANYTSYSRGINGIMVDIDSPANAPTAADFVFKVGNDNDPDGWTAAADPAVVTVRPGQGVGGSDRVTIIFDNHAIQKQWLQVTVLAGGNIGLFQDDVFYYGNAIGESGNSTTDAKVNAYDMLAARDNQRNFLDPAAIDFAYDFNRDAAVDAADMLIARDNPTHFLNALRLISVPAGKAAAEAAAPAKSSTHDAVFRQVGDASANRLSPPAELLGLGWLYEFDSAGASHRSSPQDGTAQDAVDELLAADGP